MVKSFRFLLSFAWVHLAVLYGFAVVVVAGCYATGIPDGASQHNLFENYYAMFPFLILLCLFLWAFTLCTNSLNLALSMGALRKDFFWAIQGIILLYTAISWALQRFLSVFPVAARWEARDRWVLLTIYSGKPWTYPLLCAALLVLGCLGGLLMVRHRALAVLTIVFSCLVLAGSTVFLFLYADPRMIAVLTGAGWGWVFNTLPRILVAGLTVAAIGGEVLICRAIQHYAVR